MVMNSGQGRLDAVIAESATERRLVPLGAVVLTTFSNAEHTVKLGVNYRFNWVGVR